MNTGRERGLAALETGAGCLGGAINGKHLRRRTVISTDPRIFQKLAGVWNDVLSDLSVVVVDGLTFMSDEKVVWRVDVKKFIDMTEAEIIEKLKESGLEFRIR